MGPCCQLEACLGDGIVVDGWDDECDYALGYAAERGQVSISARLRRSGSDPVTFAKGEAAANAFGPRLVLDERVDEILEGRQAAASIALHCLFFRSRESRLVTGQDQGEYAAAPIGAVHGDASAVLSSHDVH